MKKKYSLGLIISLLLVFSTACTSQQSQGNEKKKELTFLSNFPSETLDPHLNFTPVRAGISETLIKVDENQELEPWLAESWESKDNGSTWVMKIKEGIHFQNGKKVDAEAVKDSLQRNIEVSEAMKASLKIKSMEADKQILTIITEKPLPQFPSELVHPNTAIIDSKAENIEEKPVGTGPFKIQSFDANSSLKLQKNSNYWDGNVKLDQVTMMFNEDANARTAALQSGDADISYRPALESMEALKKDPAIKTDFVTSLRDQFLLYNFKNELLQDPNVRKAFDVLLDRNEVAQKTLAGQASPAEGPFVPDSLFSPEYAKKEFSIRSAKSYLSKAGIDMKDGKAFNDGKPLSLKVLTYSYRPELPLMAQLLQANAKELGLDIEIQTAENIDEYMAEKDDWDIATYSMISDPRGDAAYFFNAVYMPGGAMNHSNLQNKELTKAIEKLNETVDKAERAKLAKEASAIIDKETLHSFIVHPKNFVAYKDDVLNWETSKSEYYMITKDLDVKTKNQ
ncbi:nickel ABC transporter substrate-binding protein [Metabacillus sp. FJAT-52054]|uniref:Nickel ABC transporter substrate-binding protein n=1 Tax=Metabacillus sediminis TaxID=3117746 RepID=A0ABZ2NFK3_9BACI